MNRQNKSLIFGIITLMVILSGVYYISFLTSSSFFLIMIYIILGLSLGIILALIIFYGIYFLFGKTLSKIEQKERKKYMFISKNMKSKEFKKYEKKNLLFIGSVCLEKALLFIIGRTFNKTVHFLITKDEIVFDTKPIFILPIKKIKSVKYSYIANTIILDLKSGEKYKFRYWKFFPWDNVFYDASLNLHLINSDVLSKNKKIFKIIYDLIYR